MNLLIGSDNGYFVYKTPSEKLFTGTYTQCLIVVGGVSLGRTIEESIILATHSNASCD